MADSRRVYITLNQEKEKDRVIEEFLSNSYSEADCIKEVLYRMAIEKKIDNKENIEDKKEQEKIININRKVKQIKSDLNKIAKDMVINA